MATQENRKMYSEKEFGEALRELLREHQGDPWRISVRAFALEAGINYSALRSAVVGRNQPSLETMETVAAKLGVEPTYFREYRVAKVWEIVERYPELAGPIYDNAISLAAVRESRKANSKSLGN